MLGHDIIVIGASAGGIEAVSDLIVQFPENLKAAVFVVIHISSASPSLLPGILARNTPLKVSEAGSGTEIKYGNIYVAPSDHHLLLKDGIMITSRGPKENRARPAIDPLFRSAAAEYGPKVIGIILSGLLDDGVSGLRAIKRCNGITIVQNPEDALFPDMPQSAIQNVEIDYKLPVTKMGAVINRLVMEETNGNSDPPKDVKKEIEVAQTGVYKNSYEPNTGYVYSCPECNGPLSEIKDGTLLRYRCITGHSYTASALLSQQDDVFEAALFAALRILEERANMLERMSTNNPKPLHTKTFADIKRRAEETRQHAKVIRDLILNKEI